MENKSMLDEFACDMGLTVLMKAREAIKEVNLNTLLGLLEERGKQELDLHQQRTV